MCVWKQVLLGVLAIVSLPGHILGGRHAKLTEVRLNQICAQCPHGGHSREDYTMGIGECCEPGLFPESCVSRICMTPWVWSLVKMPSVTKPVGASFLSLSGWMYRWSVDWGILHPAWQGRGYKHGFMFEDSLLLLVK